MRREGGEEPASKQREMANLGPMPVVEKLVETLGPHVPVARDLFLEFLPYFMAASVALLAGAVVFVLGIYSSSTEPPRWIIPRGDGSAGSAAEHDVCSEDGTVLRAVVKGAADGPAIVLVHGAGSSSNVFAFLFKRLSVRGYRVYAFDLRGHGASGPAQALPPELLAADLRAVLEHFDLRDATVIGHGLGGYTALALALHFPSTAATRIGRLVLLSAFAQTPDEMKTSFGTLWRTLFSAGVLHVLFRWRRAARLLMRPFFGHHVTGTMVEEWRRAVLKCPRRSWAQGLNAGTFLLPGRAHIPSRSAHVQC